MKVAVRYSLFLVFALMAHQFLAQAPQFSHFNAVPAYNNPALVGDAKVSRLSVNFRNQWATVGNAFNTGVVAFDSYDEKRDIGWGGYAIHDQRGNALQSNMLAGQVSKLAYINSNRQLRLLGGIQAAWVSNRWNAANLTYVSDLMGIPDPIAAGALSENRLSLSAGSVLEFVPSDSERASWWLGTAWHNVAVDPEKWMGQRFGVQGGLKLPFDSPGFFGNNLGHDLDRETALTLGFHARKQGGLYQLEVGANWLYTPLIVGLWYRGLGTGVRRDALIPTLGFISANILFQVSYDIPVSSIGLNTGSLELTVWYGFDNLVSFRGNNRNARNFLKF
jgi:type IX secretion system PorP/SprF family membrane protein